ncbi:MAG: hypothetical protein J6B23_03220 [Clostridia bacterium]|nr:hypothetical protein [Clostridia bacterium]
MNTYNLKITSPDGDILNAEVCSFSVRGSAGDLAVMAGHIPFITSVTECDCKIEFEDGSEKIGHTNGGLLTVGKDKTTFLSGSFKWI